MESIEKMTFRRATKYEMPRILAMQSDVFSGEQGIPCDDVDKFLAEKPLCWCAESGGKIYAAVASWQENAETHWGRFVVFPAVRGQHIGTKLAKFSFDDIFCSDSKVEEIFMEARDATVKIVCKMGGKITGEPRKFYKGNVTPVVLKKSEYKKFCNQSS